MNVGQESTVPVNDAQGYGLTQPELPPQTQVDNQVLHSASLFAVVFKTQVLLIQASVAAAVEAFVQGTLFPTKALHIVWVPLYAVHAALGSTHPAPLVMHPVLYVPQAAFVVKVIGALVQSVDAHDVDGSYSHPFK